MCPARPRRRERGPGGAGPLAAPWAPGSGVHSLAFDGTNHLLVWGDGDVDPGGSAHFTTLVGARLDANDEILDPGGILIAATDGEEILQVTAGSGGGLSVVAWVEAGAGNDIARVRAARVAPDGAVLDAEGLLLAEIAPPAGDCPGVVETTAMFPAVTFDGEGFVVAWQRRTDPCAPGSYDLQGAPVSLAGDVGAAFAISSEPQSFGAPALASAGNGETLAAYSYFLHGAPHEAERVRYKRVVPADEDPCPGGTCSCEDAGGNGGGGGGTGGSGGSDGTGGGGGTGGAGGDAPGTGGDDGDGSTSAGGNGGPDSSEDGGCDCQAAGATPGPSAPALAALTGLLAALRLRKRRPATRRANG